MTHTHFKRGLPSALLASCASLALAQDPPAPPNDLIGLSLYGLNLSEISPEIEESVATWANPIIVTIPEGQTPRDAASQACPKAGEAYWEVFEQRSTEWNPHLPNGFDINATLNGNHIALVPNCIQSHSQTVTIGRGEWLSRDIAGDYLSELEANTSGLGVDRSVGVQDFSESVAILNNRNLSSLNSLREGEELLIPLPRADFITSAEGADAISGAVRNSFGDWSVGINTPGIGGGSLSATTAPEPAFVHDNLPPRTCSGQSEGDLLQRHSTSFAETYEAIFWNMRQARNVGRETPSKTAIAILDTGLPDTDWWRTGGFVKPIKENEKDTMFLPEALRTTFAASTADFAAVFGAAFTEAVSRGKTHTETVLGAALGGYYGYLFNASFGVFEPSVYSVFELIPTGDMNFPFAFAPEINEMENAIETIASVGQSFIVNISAGTPVDRNETILKALKSSPGGKDLFIVAAGNNGENAAADGSKIYPANYGGENAEDMPLITVGGYQNAPWGIWERSNRGNHVDILALGCDVQTVRFAPNSGRNLVTLDHDMGTSLAAPRVTFTAAMVQHLLSHRQNLDRVDNESMVIKHRLLSASDLHPSMEQYVVDGRVLNIAKAVNVFSDLVEFSSGEMLRGKVSYQTGTSPIDACGDGTRIDPASILKIAQWKPDIGENYKIYFTTDRSKKLQQCVHFQPPRLEFVPARGAQDPIRLDQFKDIVFATPRL